MKSPILMKMRLWVLFLLVSILLSGCGRFSTEKGVSDCNFEAAKLTRSELEQNDIAYACMKAKGYEMSGEKGCEISLAQFPLCWKKTWRVLLP